MQAPGPPGFPQPAQGSGSARPAGSCEEVANTESFLSSFSLWHEGHSGLSLARTSLSNSVPQLEQRYSKIGMLTSISLDPRILHRSGLHSLMRNSGSKHRAWRAARLPGPRQVCNWPEVRGRHDQDAGRGTRWLINFGPCSPMGGRAGIRRTCGARKSSARGKIGVSKLEK